MGEWDLVFVVVIRMRRKGSIDVGQGQRAECPDVELGLRNVAGVIATTGSCEGAGSGR